MAFKPPRKGSKLKRSANVKKVKDKGKLPRGGQFGKRKGK